MENRSGAKSQRRHDKLTVSAYSHGIAANVTEDEFFLRGQGLLIRLSGYMMVDGPILWIGQISKNLG